MSDNVELLRCPFCGSAPKKVKTSLGERFWYADEVMYVCTGCRCSRGARGDTSNPGYADNSTVERRALEAWNTRAALSQQPTDAMLDEMRRRGLSIDGDNAYKRDLIDCIIGVLVYGKQNTNPPPEGHWAQQFWEIGRAEGEIQEGYSTPSAPAPAAQEPVAWQARFTDPGQEWSTCSKEHHALVQANPREWPGYETRGLFAAPPAAEQPDTVKLSRADAEVIASFFETGGSIQLVDAGYRVAHRLRALLGKESV